MRTTSPTTRPAKPTPTTDGRFVFDVLRHDGPVLVDFWASWCPSCRHLEPVLDDLAREWDGLVKVVKLDIEKNGATSGRYGVRSIPTLVLFVDGAEVHRLVDVVKRRRIEDELAEHLFGG